MHFLFEKQKPDKQLAVVEKVLSLLLFVEFEIIGSSAGWMRAENTLIQTAEYDFCLLCIKVFSDFFQSHAADKFKSSPTNIITDLSPRSSVFSAAGISSAENVCCFGSPVFTAIFQR